jgi:hypothetical protein
MHTIASTLAWKEWHEHKWKLAALVATTCSVSALILRERSPWIFDAIRVTLVICIVPLAIFIGLGSAANERSRNTFRFLQAFPVTMWRVALNKLLAGAATIVATVLLTIGFAYVWCAIAGIHFSGAELRPAPQPFTFGLSASPFIDLIAPVLYIALSFYIWASACGVNRKDEVSAGAIALLLMVIWTALVIFCVHGLDLATKASPEHRLAAVRVAAVAFSTIPGGLMHIPELNNTWGLQGQIENLLLLGAIAAFITHAGLIAWYIVRFGRLSNLEVRSAQAAKRTLSAYEWLGTPRRSAFTSIAWKQLREGGPIAMLSLAGIIAFVAFFQGIEWLETGRRSNVGEIYIATAAFVGFIVALMIGLGVAFYDIQPQIVTFWRSRPINPDLWFWCKFITGLTVLLAAIYIPMWFVAELSDLFGTHVFQLKGALIIPLGQLAIFASAIAMLSLVRHAIYAAILTIAFAYCCIDLGVSAWYVATLLGWADPNVSRTYEPDTNGAIIGLIMCIVIATSLAWLAMRYDWGRKSRY